MAELRRDVFQAIADPTRREILQLIAAGHSTKSIAAQLHISEHTAAEHAHTILKKLEAKNRAEAVAIALRKQWIR